MPNPVISLAHIGLRTGNIEHSALFYQSLGFVLQERLNIPVAEGSVEIAFLAQAGIVVELYQLPNGADKTCIGYGFEHVALNVSSLEDAMDWVGSLGHAIVEGPTVLPSGERGVRYFMIAGPDNERVEFAQRL